MALSLAISGMTGFSAVFAANDVNVSSERTNTIWDSVKLLGRTHVRDDGTLWLALSGTGIEFTYQGPSFEITVLGDSNSENEETNQTNAARVAFYVDGEQRNKDMVREKVLKYTVPASEGKTEVIRLLKLSESYPSTIGIAAFDIPEGGTISPTEKKTYNIEFIGDSITCGVGVDAVNGEANDKSLEKEDITKAYSYKTAEKLDADYSMVSYAGHGVIAGYTETPGVRDNKDGKDERVTVVYDCFGKSWSNFIQYGDESGIPQNVEWDFSRFPTDAVVINLGTNDFSYCRVDDKSQYKVDDTRGEEFVQGYIDFLGTVREKNPKAEIFCVVGPGGGPMDPYIADAVGQYTEAKKDNKVHAFPFGTIEGANAAGGFHPSDSAHTITAEKLANYMRPYLEAANYEPERLGVAVCGQFATVKRTGEVQWYIGTKASGEDAAVIAGAEGSAYLSSANDIGKWLFCAGKGMAAADEQCDRFKVVGSLEEGVISYAYATSTNDKTTEKYIKNVGTSNGYVNPAKWAPGGYLKVTMSSISKPDDIQLMYNAWTDSDRKNKKLSFSEKTVNSDGTISYKWTYEDILSNWYNDPDFAGWNALRIVHDAADDDAIKNNLTVEYIGPSMETPQTSIVLPEAAEYGKPADAGSGSSFQWLKAAKASGADAQMIQGETGQTYTPGIEDIGGWLLCSKTENGVPAMKKFRVVASKEMKEIELPVTDKKLRTNQDGTTANYALLNNTVSTSGKIDPGKWAPGGRVEITVKGITYNEDSLPRFELQTWTTDADQHDRKTQYVTASRSEETNGEIILSYDYQDILGQWYNDGDFEKLKALRVNYSGEDKADLEIIGAKYIGPALSYGELGELVPLRGSRNGYQYQFSRHVGGSFEATDLRTDDVFYVEYKDDKRNTLRFVAQCHSAKAGSGEGQVKSTYATVEPFETGKTGSGFYSRFRVSDIAEQFGTNFRYLDGIRLSFTDGKNFETADGTVYLFKGTGALVDDIKKDGYDDAVKVPWTLYDDTDKTGIAVIGASITQNPLVTPLAMSGEPFYWANGSWGAMLDRTDIVTYGIGSQTTNDITARFDEVLKYGYERIVIQCGNNDLGGFSGDDAPQKAAEQAVRNYTAMLDKAAAANIPVYIVSLNPVNSAATNKKIPTVIAELKKLIAERYNGLVTYIDVYNEFKDPNADRSQADLVMSDGLHPVAKGYAIYAKHLKELLASDDPKDTSLVSLSWRKTTGEKKNIVTGFASGDSGDKTYTVNLGNMANDAVIRLYETANNLNAQVSADCGDIQVEEFRATEDKVIDGENIPAVVKTDDYVEVKLEGGRKTVKLTVKAEDGSSTSTYTINFTTENSVSVPALYEGEEKYQTLTDDNCVAQSWPYILWNDMDSMKELIGGQKYKMEFDIEIENRDFTGIYIEGKANWNNVTGYQTMKPEDFDTNNTLHISGEFTPQEDITSLAVTVGNEDQADYRGSVTVRNLRIVLAEN